MFRATFSLMVGNLASKILGLLREVLFAAWFGTTEVAAAFRISQSLVTVLIHSFVGDTLAGGMLPYYQRLRSRSEADSRFLLVVALTQGAVIGICVGAIMFFFAAHIVTAIAPGASHHALAMATTMVRIMALVAPVYIIGNTLAYIESSHGRYSALSSRTSLANVGIIVAGGIAFFLHAPLYLAWGFVVVYFIFMIMTIIDCARSGVYSSIFGRINADILPILVQFEKNVGSLLGIFAIAQFNVVVEKIVSSSLGTGVIPALDYAKFLTDTLTTLLAVPLGITTMVSFGGRTTSDIKMQAAKLSSLLIAVTTPLSIVFFFSSHEIVNFVFRRGAFDNIASNITASILQTSAIGLSATVTSYYLIKVMNTSMKNKAALMITMAAVAANVAINFSLWRYLGPCVLGVGASISGFSMLVLCISVIGLWTKLAPLILKNLVAAAAASITIYFLPRNFASPVKLLIVITIVGIYWSVLWLASADVRRAVAPITSKLQGTITPAQMVWTKFTNTRK